MLQNLEANVDEFNKSDRSGRYLHRSEGKVYSGQRMINLLIRSEIRREIRDEISFLIDRMGQYLASKGKFAVLFWYVLYESGLVLFRASKQFFCVGTAFGSVTAFLVQVFDLESC